MSWKIGTQFLFHCKDNVLRCWVLNVRNILLHKRYLFARKSILFWKLCSIRSIILNGNSTFCCDVHFKFWVANSAKSFLIHYLKSSTSTVKMKCAVDFQRLFHFFKINFLTLKVYTSSNAEAIWAPKLFHHQCFLHNFLI